MATESVVLGNPADEDARREAMHRLETQQRYAELVECEPPCTCYQTDVDLFNAGGCEAHDPGSDWNVALRAVTPVQQYECYERVAEPMDPPECPF